MFRNVTKNIWHQRFDKINKPKEEILLLKIIINNIIKSRLLKDVNTFLKA